MYIHYLNLPTIPESVINSLPKDYNSYEKKVDYGVYVWTDAFNAEVNEWCKQNICSTMYWGFQIISDELPVHKDIGTYTKLIYLLEPGGENVLTNFFAEDQTTVIGSYNIEPNRWHVLKADTYHNVTNIEPGKVRFSITGRLFGDL